MIRRIKVIIYNDIYDYVNISLCLLVKFHRFNLGGLGMMTLNMPNVTHRINRSMIIKQVKLIFIPIFRNKK